MFGVEKNLSKTKQIIGKLKFEKILKMTYNYYSKFERSSLKSTTLKNIYQSGAAVAQRVHIPKVAGSNPASGTKGF